MPRTWLEQANAPHSPSDGGLADTTGLPPRRAPIARLPSRQVLVELEPGVFELPPSLVGLPLVRAFPRHSTPRRVAIQRPSPRLALPPLDTPTPKSIFFVHHSVHFQRPTQAERELMRIVQGMKQFPRLQITIQGNVEVSLMMPEMRGFSATARAYQDKKVGYLTEWPKEREGYLSAGGFMEARARAIRQHLIKHGISAQRITAMRGQCLRERSVTIIFSN